MKEYETELGDTFEKIAHKQLGSSKYVEELINANREYISTFIFKAGIRIKIPEVTKSNKVKLPPWRY